MLLKTVLPPAVASLSSQRPVEAETKALLSRPTCPSLLLPNWRGLLH